MDPSKNGEDDSLQKGDCSLSSVPPGMVFSPTDTQLVMDFLRRKKVDNMPLPLNVIVEVNIYDHNPDALAERYEPVNNNEWFFFTPLTKKYPGGQRPNRAVAGGEGYWRASSGDKDITFMGRKVANRKALVFYRRGTTNPVKTDWLMHEYRLAESVEPPRNSGDNNMTLDECVLCKIYRKGGERLSKRSRHESGLGDGPDDGPGDGPNQSTKSTKTPKFDLNLTPAMEA